jgi:hypothetical protein
VGDAQVLGVVGDAPEGGGDLGLVADGGDLVGALEADDRGGLEGLAPRLASCAGVDDDVGHGPGPKSGRPWPSQPAVRSATSQDSHSASLAAASGNGLVSRARCRSASSAGQAARCWASISGVTAPFSAPSTLIRTRASASG